MNTSADVWNQVQKQLEAELSQTTINTWFDDAEVVDITGDSFVLYTPSPFKKDIITGRYTGSLKTALRHIFSGEIELVVLTGDEKDGYRKNKNSPMDQENVEYTFDRFVVGNSNKFAHAAAVAVAENPGTKYNPLFIYGGSGLGKTHLLYAIAHEIRKKEPAFSISYMSAEDFTNELVAAIRNGQNVEFHNKYRAVDMLLIDDIQFIAGKEFAQEEFFHTFNALHQNKKQIVLTSDRPPMEMNRLEDRLKTRFESGIIADIQPPDFETRMAIIKSKSFILGFDLPNDVVNYIADNITANVRQLEGTVKKVLAYRDLMHDDVSIETTARAIKDIFKEYPGLSPTPEIIIGEVSRYYSIDQSEIRGQRRGREIVLARQVAMYLIRRMTQLSLPDIGKEFDGRDHTTVIHSLEKIENSIKQNPEFAEVIKEISYNISNK